MTTSRLKIHETTRDDGTLAPTFLVVEDGVVGIESNDEALALPRGALGAVMRRFGKALDPSTRVTMVGALDVGGGALVRHVRHLATYDVIARDWLVYEEPGVEPLCALATSVAGALAHLAQASLRR